MLCKFRYSVRIRIQYSLRGPTPIHSRERERCCENFNILLGSELRYSVGGPTTTHSGERDSEIAREREKDRDRDRDREREREREGDKNVVEITVFC